MIKDLLAGGAILSAGAAVVCLIAMSTVGVLIAAIFSDMMRFIGFNFGGNKWFTAFRVLIILSFILYIIWRFIPE